MEAEVYCSMAAQEDRHWWFVGRRSIIKSLIQRRVVISQGARLLEVGCGTGGNLAMLSTFGALDAIEYHESARHIARQRSRIDVMPGALPDDLSHAHGPYDLVALFDVLEHIDQDVDSLHALSSLMSCDGRLIVTVPALPFLWSKHDELHHHKRRYSKESLCDAIKQAGLDVEYVSYFNLFLLPLAIMHRLISRFQDGKVLETPSGVINMIFTKVFSGERIFMRYFSLPVGLSLCAICRPRHVDARDC